MQFIEGERPVIERLFAAICEGTRHHSVQILQRGEQDVRQFPDWWMVGFNLHDEHVGYLPGYSVFPLTHEMFQTAHSRQRLFQSFKR